ncbi:hypothetical protein ACFWUW_07350 [Streptomyces sp. NPDC058655]|uniref:hypothetical protein n=1 Tax=unclassified Streptomyces TaxID=2593676 RepID=UPI003649FCEE
MSNNQPGPYGQQPQQPGPYGQQPPAPGPYGQGAPQPGYGYPQQPGVPPQGHPQQPPQQAPYGQGAPQAGYGYPQQPGVPPQAPYGGMPPQQPPKKSKTGIVIAAVVAVAVIAGGSWYFLQGGDSEGAVSAATKGYKIVPPDAVGDFKKNPKYTQKTLSDEDRKEAEAAGIKDPAQAGMDYQSGDPSNPLSLKSLNFQGIYGEIAAPEKAVDLYFAAAKKGLGEENKKATAEFIGTPKAMTPAGFKGAVMKCQELKLSSKDTTAKGPKEFTMPLCIWGDFSTVGVVSATDIAAVLGGNKGYTLEQTADFGAKLYATARVKK